MNVKLDNWLRERLKFCRWSHLVSLCDELVAFTPPHRIIVIINRLDLLRTLVLQQSHHLLRRHHASIVSTQKSRVVLNAVIEHLSLGI